MAVGSVVDINGTFTQTYDDYMSGIAYKKQNYLSKACWSDEIDAICDC